MAVVRRSCGSAVASINTRHSPNIFSNPGPAHKHPGNFVKNYFTKGREDDVHCFRLPLLGTLCWIAYEGIPLVAEVQGDTGQRKELQVTCCTHLGLRPLQAFSELACYHLVVKHPIGFFQYLHHGFPRCNHCCDAGCGIHVLEEFFKFC